MRHKAHQRRDRAAKFSQVGRGNANEAAPEQRCQGRPFFKPMMNIAMAPKQGSRELLQFFTILYLFIILFQLADVDILQSIMTSGGTCLFVMPLESISCVYTIVFAPDCMLPSELIRP